MPSLISRTFALLILFTSYYGSRWVVTVWQWVGQQGHTEGPPAGLGIFAIGVAIDFFLIIAGLMLAIVVFLGLFFPWKKLIFDGIQTMALNFSVAERHAYALKRTAREAFFRAIVRCRPHGRVG